MKVDRHGKAKVLTTEEIAWVFHEGLTNERDRAIFAICLYTACRIKEFRYELYKKSAVTKA